MILKYSLIAVSGLLLLGFTLFQLASCTYHLLNPRPWPSKTITYYDASPLPC